MERFKSRHSRAGFRTHRAGRFVIGGMSGLAFAVCLFAPQAVVAQASNEYRPVPTEYHPVKQEYTPVRQDYAPARSNIKAGSALSGAPSAGSLPPGAPSAGSLTMGKPTAGSLGGNIAAGSIAPPVGVPVNTIAVPMSSLATSPGKSTSLAERHRMMKSDDRGSSDTRSRRSERSTRSNRRSR